MKGSTLGYILILALFISITGRCASQELLQNGDFENGANIWTTYAVASGVPTSAGIVKLGNAYRGDWYAFVGDKSPSLFHARGVLRQNFKIPLGTTSLELTFRLNVTSAETSSRAIDKLEVNIRNMDDRVLMSVGNWSNRQKDKNGNPKAYVRIEEELSNLPLNEPLILQFYAETDDSLYTTFRIDNVSLNATVQEIPVTFSVIGLAGEHGTIDPDGQFSRDAGSDIAFTASPQSGYEVDRWFVNNQERARGGSRYTLRDLDRNTVVHVSFRAKTFSITASAENGTVEIVPSKDEFASGEYVELRAHPALGYVFKQWSGDLSGRSNPLNHKIKKDIQAQAEFLKLPQEIKLENVKANNHAPSFTVEREPGWVYVVRLVLGIEKAHAAVDFEVIDAERTLEAALPHVRKYLAAC